MRKDIVVIGASAGGLEALRSLVAALPADFPASVFVVLHTSAESPGLLAAILDRSGPLPADTASDGEHIRPGRIYVAPPDHHLVVEPGVVRTTRGPRENRFRPAIDPLFRSAAQVYGPRVVGLILTGYLDDGTAGLWTVKQLGGTAVVQDPADALVDSMPLSALQHVKVDYCVRLSEMAPLLVRLAGEAADEGAYEVPEETGIEVRIAKADKALEAGVMKLGEPSNYTCPECHGVLLQMKQDDRIRFRCHTGHAYSLESLVAEIDESIEESLWSALRSVEEKVLLMNHIAEHVRATDNGAVAEQFLRSAQVARRRADLVHQAVMVEELSPAKSGDAK
ncbi:MAG TPA: chemotaxis protein CheB [Pyrinomonadaceae bacterium]|jgi:two-component system chemotaxis response regulator CheB|nr:chemotaxis protein CheB [Pyrinomonadaceae bacterium]